MWEVNEATPAGMDEGDGRCYGLIHGGTGALTGADRSDLTILVVDDDPQMRSFLERVLKNRCRVLLASDGQEGLGLAIRERPDIILTDNDMPVLEGIAMVREIRKAPTGRPPRVILMTGSHLLEPDSVPRDARIDVLLSKPFTPEELLDAVGLGPGGSGEGSRGLS